MEREYQYDNIKFFLIFLVVFGHLLEYISGSICNNIYRIIYTFHMPVFIFITGYFAKFNKKKIIFQLFIPYLLLQTIYIIYDCKYISHTNISFQFVTPYWILWFLLTLIYYYLLIPLIDTDKTINKILFILGSIVISLFASATKNIGYYASLLRFFTFLPYFVLGYYFKKSKLKEYFNNNKIRWITGLLATLFVLLSSLYIIFNTKYTKYILYGSFSYNDAYYNMGMKAFLLILGLAWVIFFITIFPKKKLPFISYIGTNTFYIFILHGFIIKYLGVILKIFIYSEAINIFYAAAIALLLIIALGNKIIKIICNYLLNYEWIYNLIIKIKDKLNTWKKQNGCEKT